jgi:hypothetical protein
MDIMKTKISTIALIAIVSISSHLVAQEGAVAAQEQAVKGSWDQTKNMKCRVSPSEKGYSIAFEYDTKTPADVSVDELSGKKGYDYYKAVTEYSVNSSDNTITEVKSPRDAASGMVTGKRMHWPIRVEKEIDKSTPVLNKEVSGKVTMDDTWTVGRSGGGAGKVSMQDISFTKRCAGNTTVFSLVDGECVIPTGDCPNGDCNLKIVWTWNDASAITEIGSSGMDGVKTNSVDFILQIQDGGCTAMAINEKGLPGEKKPKKTKSKN